MLEELTIHNFQAHRKFHVEFDKNCTFFVGQNDVGKSSLLRALLWVMTNQPLGDSFISWGRSAATVRLVVADELGNESETYHVRHHSITRHRGPGSNTYTLDGKVYRAFRNDPPDAIRKLLNVGPVNFQFQLDSPFWFLDSPGQVARSLNSIINLGSIDTALSNAAAGVRKVKAELEVCQQRLAEARQRRDVCKWAVRCSQAMEKLDHVEKQRVAVSQKAQAVHALVDRLAQAETALERQKVAQEASARLQAALRSLERVRGRREALKRFVLDLNKWQAVLDQDVPDLTVVQQMRERGEKGREKVRRLSALLLGLEEQEHLTKKYADDLKVVEKKLGEVDQCPLCGQFLAVTGIFRSENRPAGGRKTGSTSRRGTSNRSSTSRTSMGESPF